MKKMKTSGVGANVTHLQSESDSLTPDKNDEFKDFPPIPTADTMRFIGKEEDGDVREVIDYEEEDEYEDNEEEEEEEDEDEDEDDEEDEEDDDEEVEEEVEEEEIEPEEKGNDVFEDVKTPAERKKLADGFFEVESIRKKRICKVIS